MDINITGSLPAIRTGINVLKLAFDKGDNELITSSLAFLDRTTRYAELGIDINDEAAADTVERAKVMDDIVARGGVGQADIDALKVEMTASNDRLAAQLEDLDAIAARQSGQD